MCCKSQDQTCTNLNLLYRLINLIPLLNPVLVIACRDNYNEGDQALILKFKTANIEYQDQTFKIPIKSSDQRPHIFNYYKFTDSRNFCALGREIHSNSNQVLFETPRHRERNRSSKFPSGNFPNVHFPK